MMTTILVSLIVASWVAVVLTRTQNELLGRQAESLEAIAIPVMDQPSAYAARAAANRNR